ncbi:TetR family transcriptional regulator [Streptomyces mashuensis]|uniref:TetR family transcriptional regulator n=1 Tax=Streptomyces mashuensis TaxID=33904 RepID=A0A919B6M1_9ACTN|nr:TetR family transcriptional regulator [Streptomyces mashuensis]GHF61078.1 TetR family transcriptional regulator [Streptomyces mashuensis]
MPTHPTTSLRERKKLRTRRAILRAAYRLFAEHGYDATPVDRIAAEADVSTSTVFRYFPTKEDIVLTDGYGELLAEAVRARPAGEPAGEAVRQAVLATVRHAVDQDLAELRQRTRLVHEVPALRGRSAESMARSARTLCAVLAGRTGHAPGDLELRVAVAAVLGALQEAVMLWVEQGQTEDLVGIVTRTLDVLARGLTP